MNHTRPGAINITDTHRPYLVLMDIMTPGMSGIDLYCRIETLDPALTQRVMFITGDIVETGTMDFLDRTKVPHSFLFTEGPRGSKHQDQAQDSHDNHVFENSHRVPEDSDTNNIASIARTSTCAHQFHAQE